MEEALDLSCDRLLMMSSIGLRAASCGWKKPTFQRNCIPEDGDRGSLRNGCMFQTSDGRTILSWVAARTTRHIFFILGFSAFYLNYFESLCLLFSSYSMRIPAGLSHKDLYWPEVLTFETFCSGTRVQEFGIFSTNTVWGTSVGGVIIDWKGNLSRVMVTYYFFFRLPVSLFVAYS